MAVTKNESIALYKYMCEKIVGTRNHVRTIRKMNSVRDNLKSDKKWSRITSGSLGEGLQMRNSDLDFMSVYHGIEVSEDANIKYKKDKMYFTMETEDTQPGFTQLRLLYSNDQSILKYCEKIGHEYYYSNFFVKQQFTSRAFPTVHGPCVSDEYGIFDFAFCVHSKSWLTSSNQWITRQHNSWPGYDLKQTVVKHGVLYVPIGVKGSVREDIEWRISFSVAEKLLIYTFTHTQLLCYALMKILLKDVIALDVGCKEIVCSYFMKTIIFWISEEISTSIWKPENLISNFLRCFKRFMYFVEYSFCPHYFITDNNLFENKIKGQAKTKLLNKLKILNSYGWKCILFSHQLTNFKVMDINKQLNCSYANSVKQLYVAMINVADDLPSTHSLIFEKVIHKVLSVKSSKIKHLYKYYMSKFYWRGDQLTPFENLSGNKSSYTNYKTHISTLLLSTHHDAVSGWLLLASYFYRTSQYNKTLHILQYTSLKFSPEKLDKIGNFSGIHSELLSLHLFRKMDIVQLWKVLLLDFVIFMNNSTIIPEELQIEVSIRGKVIPSEEYAHLLGFLCKYHLHDTEQCIDAFEGLGMIIDKNYVKSGSAKKALSHDIVGLCFQMLGDEESAKLSFVQSIKLDPDTNLNSAFQRLSLLNGMRL